LIRVVGIPPGRRRKASGAGVLLLIVIIALHGAAIDHPLHGAIANRPLEFQKGMLSRGADSLSCGGSARTRRLAATRVGDSLLAHIHYLLPGCFRAPAMGRALSFMNASGYYFLIA
jgi:hypothetical protein